MRSTRDGSHDMQHSLAAAKGAKTSTHLLLSSAVSSAGSVLVMPSFFSRRSMTGAKVCLPSLSAHAQPLISLTGFPRSQQGLCIPQCDLRATMDPCPSLSSKHLTQRCCLLAIAGKALTACGGGPKKSMPNFF